MNKQKHYDAIYADGRKQDKHRYIVEQMLGRKLDTNEVVHHKDGDKWNNDPSNLEVMTREEHTRLHQTGRKYGEEMRQKCREKQLGVPNTACRKLTPAQVIDIRHLCEAGHTIRDISQMYGIHHTTVLSVVNRKTYKDVE